MDQYRNNILLIAAMLTLYLTLFDARFGMVLSLLVLVGLALFTRRRKPTS